MADAVTGLWNARDAARAKQLLQPDYLPDELEAYLLDRMAQDMPLIPAGNIAGLTGSTYTPTLTQSGSVTNTTTLARYIRLGKIVHVWISLSVTGSGTTNNSITVSLPITALSTSVFVGTGQVVDIGTAVYPAHWYTASTTTIAARRVDTGGSSDIGVDPNFALANTDSIAAVITYEAA